MCLDEFLFHKDIRCCYFNFFRADSMNDMQVYAAYVRVSYSMGIDVHTHLCVFYAMTTAAALPI